tara:strand:- start:246 stop:425 length:180 start_codon:yes stop_codon:yes gene_type:complete
MLNDFIRTVGGDDGVTLGAGLVLMRAGTGIELESQFSPKTIDIIRTRWNAFELIKAELS